MLEHPDERASDHKSPCHCNPKVGLFRRNSVQDVIENDGPFPTRGYVRTGNVESSERDQAATANVHCENHPRDACSHRNDDRKDLRMTEGSGGDSTLMTGTREPTWTSPWPLNAHRDLSCEYYVYQYVALSRVQGDDAGTV